MTLLGRFLDVVYGGFERPADDAGILLGIASWMDRMDDVTDGRLAKLGSEHRVSRAMQADLRRIAERLTPSDGASCAELGCDHT